VSGNLRPVLYHISRRIRWIKTHTMWVHAGNAACIIYILFVIILTYLNIAHWRVYVAAALGTMALGTGLVYGYMKQPAMIHVARSLDKRLHLHDMLATAFEYRQLPDPGPLVSHLNARTETVISDIDPVELYPYRWPRKTVVLLSVLVIAIAVSFPQVIDTLESTLPQHVTETPMDISDPAAVLSWAREIVEQGLRKGLDRTEILEEALTELEHKTAPGTDQADLYAALAIVDALATRAGAPAGASSLQERTSDLTPRAGGELPSGATADPELQELLGHLTKSGEQQDRTITRSEIYRRIRQLTASGVLEVSRLLLESHELDENAPETDTGEESVTGRLKKQADGEDTSDPDGEAYRPEPDADGDGKPLNDALPAFPGSGNQDTEGMYPPAWVDLPEDPFGEDSRQHGQSGGPGSEPGQDTGDDFERLPAHMQLFDLEGMLSSGPLRIAEFTGKPAQQGDNNSGSAGTIAPPDTDTTDSEQEIVLRETIPLLYRTIVKKYFQ